MQIEEIKETEVKTWIADLTNSVGVSYIPKCGSFSIRSSMPYHARLTNAEAEAKLDNRIAFIRHPITRLRSAYAFLSVLDNNVPECYEDFIDFSFEKSE